MNQIIGAKVICGKYMVFRVSYPNSRDCSRIMYNLSYTDNIIQFGIVLAMNKDCELALTSW